MNYAQSQLSTNSQQRGVAVIAAMLLAALTTIVVGQLVWQQQLLISELENQQSATQANLIADAAIQWARAILAEDALSSNIDHNQEVWATKLPNIPTEGGKISGQIIDQQQFLNLNNVVNDNSAQAGLNRLLTSLNLSNSLTSTLMDWLDIDDISNGADGAESNYYRSLSPAYQAANQLLTEPGNLIRVKGYDQAVINKIAPFTTVLPKNTEINVNTASAEVLSIILPDTILAQAQGIVSARNIAFFKDLSDLKARGFTSENNNIDTTNINLSVDSHYFLVNCNAQFERANLNVTALLYRDTKGWPTVVWKRNL